MNRILVIHVYGIPQAQGSMRAFLIKGQNRPIVTYDNKKTKPWKQEISGTAKALMAKEKLERCEKGEIHISCRFFFEKPKSTPARVTAKVTKPDVDKLARAVLDSLTGIVFRDDAQVTSLAASKAFCGTESPHVKIEIEIPSGEE